MAKQTWNVDRKKGGTFSFNLDAQGNYTLKKDGFAQVKTLNLPELKPEATKTITTKDTKTASAQTKKAFGNVEPFYYDKKGGGKDQYTSDYQMKKEGDLATDTTGAWDKGQWGPKPETRGAWDEGQWGPQPSKGTPISARGLRLKKASKTARTFISKVNDPKSMEYGMQLSSDMMGASTNKVDQQQKEIDKFGTGQWGPKPSSGMPVDTTYRSQTQKFKERFDPTKIQAAPQKVAPLKKVTQVTKTALKKVNTALKPLAKAVGVVMSPVTSTIGMIAGAFKETDQHKHDKAYFSKTNGILENGRIDGNASTSVFAGLNSVSAFGNLSKAATSRIATRNKTIARKGYKKGDKFYDDTKNMEKEQKDHATSQAAAKNKKDLATGGVAPGASGGGGGAGGTRVICTYFYSKNQFSLIDLQLDTEFSRNNLSDEVKIGYWFWAIPLVDWMKKHENSNNWWVKLVRNSTKLFAQERAKEIAYTMGKKNKGSLIGKFVRLFGETGCYILGTLIKPFVFDKYKIFLTEYQKDVNLRGRV